MSSEVDSPRGILAAHVSCEDIHADGIWLRVRMDCLDPAQRSGWKLHLSATPDTYGAMLRAAVPVLAKFGVPFKVLRDAEEVERMNAGERGLTQVGKLVAAYPCTEEGSAALAEALREVLRGMRGPVVPTDLAYSEDAPVFFRFGPYDGRTEIDVMAQERRLVWRTDLARDVWDLTSGGTDEMPRPQALPHRAPPDHLAFLRARFRLLRMLQLSAKGGVFIGVEEGAAAPVPLLIKTARPGTNSDVQGRDSVWALRREHALLASLRDLPGLPEAGVFLESGAASAIARPFLHGETFWDVWTSPGARTEGVRARLSRALDEIEETLVALHARGCIVRDVSAGNVLLGPDRAYLMDLELAHQPGDSLPPYRRGTRGYFDPAKDRAATPEEKDDAFALRVLRAMVDDGTPAVVSAYLGERSFTTGDTEGHGGKRGEERAEKTASGGGVWNIYSGIAGHVWCAFQQNKASGNPATGGSFARADIGDAPQLPQQPLLRTPDWETNLALAAEQVLHVPGLYFGASGIAMVLGLLEGGDTAMARALLARIPVETSEVPDLCQGVAGYLLACLELFEATKHHDFLVLAARGEMRLRDLAGEEDGGRVWRWPVGPFGDLSGTACYGFGHGVAGICYALMRLHAVAPADALADEIGRALDTLASASRAVPGAGKAVWWPVSSRDETCWNAWCHGTPGVIKTLALARKNGWTEPAGDLLERALRGMYCANNSELCLCHGVASRLDAATDACAIPGFVLEAAVRKHADADAELLARALNSAASAHTHELFHTDTDEPQGLMTGPLGAIHTRHRWNAVNR